MIDQDFQNVESKRHARCISLQKDNYENNVSYLPLFDRARFECVRPNPNGSGAIGICSAQRVRERDIGPDELAEQTAHARLMISHQLREGVVIIIEKNASDEVCIRKRHCRSLGQRRNFVSTTALQFPDQQIPEADHEGDHAQAPDATLPIVHRPEKDHQAKSNHEEDDTAPEIGSRPNDWRWREESGRHFLALFDHCADGAMQGTRFQITEEHDCGDNQNGGSEER